METGIEGVTFEEARFFTEHDKKFRQKVIDIADGVIQISFNERNEFEEECTVLIQVWV